MERQRDRLSSDAAELRVQARAFRDRLATAEAEAAKLKGRVGELEDQVRAGFSAEGQEALKEREDALRKEVAGLESEIGRLRERLRADETPVAYIDGDPIPASRYKDVLYTRYRRTFIDAFVHEMIVERKAKSLGITLTGLEIDEWVTGRVREIEVQMGGPEMLKTRLRESGKPMSALREDLAQLAPSALYARKLCQRERTEEEFLRRVYEEKYGARIHVRHILVASKHDPDADAEATAAAKKEALDRAKKLKARVTGGADFAELAKQVSDDPESAKNGGDLGRPMHRYELVEEFAEVAFALKPGEVSEPVESRFGYHLIQTTRIDPPKKSFEEARAEVEKTRELPVTDAEVEKLIERLKHEVKVEKVLK